MPILQKGKGKHWNDSKVAECGGLEVQSRVGPGDGGAVLRGLPAEAGRAGPGVGLAEEREGLGPAGPGKGLSPECPRGARLVKPCCGLRRPAPNCQLPTADARRSWPSPPCVLCSFANTPQPWLGSAPCSSPCISHSASWFWPAAPPGGPSDPGTFALLPMHFNPERWNPLVILIPVTTRASSADAP